MPARPPDVEVQLQRFADYVLARRLVRDQAARYIVSWVRRFLQLPADDRPLADRVRSFCEGLERSGRVQDWQVRQAEQALRIGRIGRQTFPECGCPRPCRESTRH